MRAILYSGCRAMGIGTDEGVTKMARHWARAPMPREQIVLFSPALEEAISEDHPVRLLDGDSSRRRLVGLGNAVWRPPWPSADSSAYFGGDRPLRADAPFSFQPRPGIYVQAQPRFHLAIRHGRPKKRKRLSRSWKGCSRRCAPAWPVGSPNR